MVTRTEGSFEGHDGAELFYQTWMTSEARGTLVLTHGINEHSESYDRFFATHMAPRGYNIIGWDLRGHGRSHGKRGYVDKFQTFSDDLDSFIDFLEREGKLSLPYSLISHSMGGLITLKYLIDHGPRGAASLCLSAPLLGVALAVPPVKDFAARVLFRLAPTVTLYNEIRYEDLTRDPEMLASYKKDPLRHEKISPTLYLGILEMMAVVKARGAKIELPTLMQLAGQEKVVSRADAETFFQTIGAQNKRLIIYEESYHEIFNDLDRERVFGDLDSFLKETMRLT
ncbi:MAG: lysophospholipase [Bdellovibrionaceae bacterium]|nr:lysophospholipase [Pseudobdellovibrionaceae bacterium]